MILSPNYLNVGSSKSISCVPCIDGQVLLPVGLPDEGTFDWVDQFLTKNKLGSSKGHRWGEKTYPASEDTLGDLLVLVGEASVEDIQFRIQRVQETVSTASSSCDWKWESMGWPVWNVMREMKWYSFAVTFLTVLQPCSIRPILVSNISKLY